MLCLSRGKILFPGVLLASVHHLVWAPSCVLKKIIYHPLSKFPRGDFVLKKQYTFVKKTMRRGNSEETCFRAETVTGGEGGLKNPGDS